MGITLMKRFSIHTENKNEAWIKELLSIGFDGFTIIKGHGFWKGIEEKSLEIIIYTDNTYLVKAIAEKIKNHNKQDAILIAETEVTINLV